MEEARKVTFCVSCTSFAICFLIFFQVFLKKITRLREAKRNPQKQDFPTIEPEHLKIAAYSFGKQNGAAIMKRGVPKGEGIGASSSLCILLLSLWLLPFVFVVETLSQG